MSKDVVDIYLETGDFKEAVRRSGLPTLIAHIKLLESGVLKIKDKIKYSSKKAIMGAKAEERFQKIVPNAIDANRIIKRNNPIFDFMYGDLTIDVKYCGYRKRRKKQVFWEMRISKCDVIVAFLERNKDYGLKSPHIAVIPQSFITSQSTFTITNASEKFFNFIVKEKDLESILRHYEQLKKLM